MVRDYKYSVEVTAGNGQTWSFYGMITAEFQDVFNSAVKETFMALTKGKAMYGHPGKGCDGPYKITRMVIAEKK